MHTRSLLISVGLHVLMGLAMIWASHVGAPELRPLPSATVVKLIRPRQIIAPPPSKPTDEVKLPEPKPDLPPKEEAVVVPPEQKPPLEIPQKKTEPVKPKDDAPRQPTKGTANIPDVPKELVGEGVTLKLSNPGFEYDFYLGLVQSKIERNFRPPPGKKSAMAVVSFTIQKSGDVAGISLAQSSGSLLVDQAAERAVRAAGRFPPLPAQYSSGELAINIEFVANPAAGR